jgi:hypothetical protein
VFRCLAGLSHSATHLDLSQEVFGITETMDELMDSDDETMFAALMEEEAEITIADDECTT